MKLLPKLVSRTFVAALGVLLCAWRVAGQTNGLVIIIQPEDGQRFDPQFEADQLDFAFPSQTVYLKQDSQPAAQLNQSTPQKT